MSREEDDTDTPPPNLSRPIVDLYLDDVVVHRLASRPLSFADEASRSALPLTISETPAHQDWDRANRSFVSRPGNWPAAFQDLARDDDDDSYPNLVPDETPRSALPLTISESPAHQDWDRANRSFVSRPGDWPAAFHSLSLDDDDDSHPHLASALRPVPLSAPSTPSVLISAPARHSVSVSTPTRIFVPLSAPAVVESLPVAIPRRDNSSEQVLSALGYPQDEATVTVDFRNRSIRIIEALEVSPYLQESIHTLLVNTESPRQFIVPAFTGPIPILTQVPVIPDCGLTLRLNHHPEHGTFSPPGVVPRVEEYDPYHPRTPLTFTVLPFDPVPDPIPSYVCVYADIPWPQVDEAGYFNVIRWYISQRYVLIDCVYVDEQIQLYKDLWAFFNPNIVWRRSLQVFQGRVSIQLEFSVPSREIPLARWYSKFLVANIAHRHTATRPNILQYTVQFGNSFPSVAEITAIDSQGTSVHHRPAVLTRNLYDVCCNRCRRRPDNDP